MSTSTQPTPDTSRHKPQRVLACVLCQQRKVKCDRTFPCSTCKKNGAQCVPATQPRQRKRRFPERELLERLRKYEAIMRQNNVKFDALHDGTNDVKSSPDDYYSDHEQGDDESSRARSEETTEAKDIWKAMRQGYRDPHDTFYDNIFNTHDQSFTNDEHMLFGSRQTAVELSTLHPEPAHLFRLWQVYLDNVNPLLKVTHTPTLQGRIVEAASNLKDTPPTLEALMFGIYCVAVLSLDEEECQAMFKQSKVQLSTRFQFGCQQALVNSQFLRTASRDCLTALYLYLISVRSATHPKSISSMLAIAIRIAERMGLPIEARNSKCSILEAELRRRLWWSLVLFDSRVSALGDHKMTTLVPGWDCALPTNVSDSELREETKTPPKPQEQATEAIFAVVRSEIGDCIRNSPFYIEFTNPAVKPLAKKLPEDSDAVLEKELEDKYLRFCDAENRVHFMTFWTARVSIANRRLMSDYLLMLDSSTKYTPAHQEAAVEQAITWLECDAKLANSPLTKGFRWYIQIYFPFPAYVRIVQYMKGQPFSSQTERGWKAMHDNYSARYLPEALVHTPMFIPFFTNIVMGAWDAVKTAYDKAGKGTKTPELVGFINEKVAGMSLNNTEQIGEQPEGFAGMDMDDMGMPMSFGFGDPGMLFGQGEFGGGSSASYIPDTTPVALNVSQLNWGSMGWGSGGNGTF
ncbi:hypothetical protein KAF25_006027 [Fusarium avenaceum]|uniref:Zn(2)-C6 fungal-type domain-containing protein n=1 Tax=Fusarium avenaceum TaxID=40199 RepID=A0A9P7KP55_9HYPO|nr:hypothetical protein KAF25_006027 [Fusarium avenaceum]